MKPRLREIAILLIPTAILCLTFIIFSQEKEEVSNAEEAIRKTVQSYFDGIMQYDVEVLRKAFHPDARLMASLPGGRVYDAPFQKWVRFTERTAPDPTGYKNSIASIDVAGNAAVVKTVLDWPHIYYVDYLSLLKIDGEWRIVNKIWHEEKKNF